MTAPLEKDRELIQLRELLTEKERLLAETEEALRRSVIQSRVLIDTATDAIVTIRADGTMVSFSAVAEKMFGYKSEDVIGMNVSLLMPEPYREEHDDYLKRYLATGQRNIIGVGREIVAVRSSGDVFPVELYVGESAAGEDRQFTGIIRDITDSKQAKERIKQQAELLDKVHEAITVWDNEDRILFWNQGAENTFGWIAAEVIGRPVSELFFREQLELLESANRHVVQRGEWSGECVHVRRDGSQIVVNSFWSLLRDETGQPSGKVVLSVDVTDRKRLEMQMRRSQRLESIGTLASGIAHDLNNILTPILLATKLLKREMPAEARDQLLDTARASAVRGSEMVRQLLTFAGGIEGEQAPVDLRAIIAEVHSLSEHTFPKSITMRIDCGEALWSIHGDATQLSQILMNLVVNSRDAMPEGGNLVISAHNVILNGNCATIHPDAKPGPYVLLAVTDTGIGILPKHLENVFDPFFTTKEVGKGTGLGLSTALGIVKGHGGFLNIYSEEGKGTRVNVYLPARESQETALAIATAQRLPTGQGETVLIVDDEPMIRLTAKLTLESFGYHALTAGGGTEGLDVFRKHMDSIGVVLIDMMMPEMDGVAVIRALREIDPRVPIIANSGLHARGRNIEAMTAGANRFLQKPYTDDELLKVVREVLGPVTTGDSCSPT